MKKILTTLALTFMVIGYANAQHTVTFKFSDLANDTIPISIYDKDDDDIEIEQNLIAHNGVATYDLKGDKARHAYITPIGAKGERLIMFYLVPGEEGTLAGTVADCTWSGTKFFTELATFQKSVEILEKKREEYTNEMSEMLHSGVKSDSILAIIGPKMDPIDKQLMAAYNNYIKANPNSMVSATLVPFMPEKMQLLETLTNELRQGVFSDVLFGIIAQDAKEKARKKIEEGLAPGAMAPDFTLNDINGKPLSLSSLRGKYVILDFWGSWCFWCIKGMPKLKEYYAKYKDRLEVLGVDCNDTDEKWKAAVKKHEIPWKHVFNPKDSQLLKTYAIQGFPTKILIDPQGKIVKFMAGERDEFYTVLDEVMK